MNRTLSLLQTAQDSHVPDSPHDQQLVIKPKRTQGNIHWNLAVILALPYQREPNTHGTRAWGHHIALPMGEMNRVQALRQQPLKRLPQQLLTAIAKKGFCLLVEHHYGASLIHQDERIR